MRTYALISRIAEPHPLHPRGTHRPFQQHRRARRGQAARRRPHRRVAGAGEGPGSGSGRPATILNAVSTGSPTGAIDFGHSHIRVALGDDMGNVVDEVTVRLNVDRMSGEGIELACEHLEQLRFGHGTGQLSSVVAGIPGPVDVVDRAGLLAGTRLSSWVGLVPARELAARWASPSLPRTTPCSARTASCTAAPAGTTRTSST